jgi:hypothetical protein
MADAEVHLRSGTRDYVLTNNGTSFTIEAEGSDVFIMDRDGNLELAGGITQAGKSVLSGSTQVDAPVDPSDTYIWHRSSDSRSFVWNGTTWIDLSTGLPSNGSPGESIVVQPDNSVAWQTINAVPNGGTEGQALIKQASGYD